MTANDNLVVRETALQSGCLAYLTKPFSAKSLMEPLERASVGNRLPRPTSEKRMVMKPNLADR
jgi:CheY-like chemotaxis protein